MEKRKYSQWTMTYGAIGGLVGIILSQFIGDFDIAVILGGLSGSLLLIGINVIYVWRKSDKTPEFDERTINNMRKVYFYASTFFFSFLLIVLAVLIFNGVTSIPTKVVFIVLFGYFVITGIIAIIVSRK